MDDRQHSCDALLHVSRDADAAHGEFEVFLYCHAGNEAEVLKDHPDGAPRFGHGLTVKGTHVIAVDADSADVRQQLSCNQFG